MFQISVIRTPVTTRAVAWKQMVATDVIVRMVTMEITVMRRTIVSLTTSVYTETVWMVTPPTGVTVRMVTMETTVRKKMTVTPTTLV